MILGAGFAGLGAGIKTGQTIYEASNQSGGICTSYVKEGFEFSPGGPHLIFCKGEGFEYIKSLVDLEIHQRKSGVYYNKMLPYPLQTFAQRENKWNPDSLKGWLASKFGREQCNFFFYPFNEKYTCGLYDEVIQDDDFKSPPAGDKGHVPQFADPVKGLSHLVEKLKEGLDIKYNERAVKIYPDEKRVVFSTGREEKYDRLISTIPLNDLLHICGNFDYDFPYTSVLVVNVGAERGKLTPDEHWVYIPFCKSGFYRLGFPSNINKRKAPKGKVNVSIEIPLMPHQKYTDYIVKKAVIELKDWRFIGKTIVIDPTYVRCAYTWLYNKESRERALEWLKERDIISIGRYGRWSFCGMTKSLEDGLGV